MEQIQELWLVGHHILIWINKTECAKYDKTYFAKSATDSSSVTYKLNSGTQKNWLQNTNINSGYPYLKDNVP